MGAFERDRGFDSRRLHHVGGSHPNRRPASRVCPLFSPRLRYSYRGRGARKGGGKMVGTRKSAPSVFSRTALPWALLVVLTTPARSSVRKA